MKKFNSSPNRHSFQKERYTKRIEKEGKEVSQVYLDWFDNIIIDNDNKWNDPSSRENNMEWDLVSTQWICDKVKEDHVYAQHLYAAMCNNEFQKNDMMPILKDQRWGCSWRYAGGIVADMQETGDYINWYCSGIRGVDDITAEEFSELSEEQQIFFKECQAYVGESVVTDEIRTDLKKLGWITIDSDNG